MCFVVVLPLDAINTMYIQCEISTTLTAAHCRHFAAKKRKEGGGGGVGEAHSSAGATRWPS